MNSQETRPRRVQEEELWEGGGDRCRRPPLGGAAEPVCCVGRAFKRSAKAVEADSVCFKDYN